MAKMFFARQSARLKMTARRHSLARTLAGLAPLLAAALQLYIYNIQTERALQKQTLQQFPSMQYKSYIQKENFILCGAHASFRLSAGHQSASPASGNNKSSSLPFRLNVHGRNVKARASLKN